MERNYTVGFGVIVLLPMVLPVTNKIPSLENYYTKYFDTQNLDHYLDPHQMSPVHTRGLFLSHKDPCNTQC